MKKSWASPAELAERGVAGSVFVCQFLVCLANFHAKNIDILKDLAYKNARLKGKTPARGSLMRWLRAAHKAFLAS